MNSALSRLAALVSSPVSAVARLVSGLLIVVAVMAGAAGALILAGLIGVAGWLSTLVAAPVARPAPARARSGPVLTARRGASPRHWVAD